MNEHENNTKFMFVSVASTAQIRHFGVCPIFNRHSRAAFKPNRHSNKPRRKKGVQMKYALTLCIFLFISEIVDWKYRSDFEKIGLWVFALHVSCPLHPPSPLPSFSPSRSLAPSLRRTRRLISNTTQSMFVRVSKASHWWTRDKQSDMAASAQPHIINHSATWQGFRNRVKQKKQYFCFWQGGAERTHHKQRQRWGDDEQAQEEPAAPSIRTEQHNTVT